MAIVHLFPCVLYQSAALSARDSWWNVIPQGVRLIFSLTFFFINLLVLAGVLYLSGLIIVGKRRALLSDALLIAFVGSVLSVAFFLFIPYGLVASLLSNFVLLLLIRRLYETGWLGAIAVGLLAVIISLIITVLLALTFGIFYEIFERFLLFIVQFL